MNFLDVRVVEKLDIWLAPQENTYKYRQSKVNQKNTLNLSW